MQRYGDGEFVLYKDARKEISSLKAKNKQLTAELRDVEYQRDQYHEAAHRHRGEVQRLLHDAIEPLKAERDTALARAAAAWNNGFGAGVMWEASSNEGDAPIPTDAQETLDKMLSQARLEGWRAGRDAAARTCVLSGQDLAEGDWGPEGRDMAVMLEGRIRDLPIPTDASDALNQMLDEAYAAGQERMREAAAQECEDRRQGWPAPYIRALPITPRPDREGRT